MRRSLLEVRSMMCWKEREREGGYRYGEKEDGGWGYAPQELRYQNWAGHHREGAYHRQPNHLEYRSRSARMEAPLIPTPGSEATSAALLALYEEEEETTGHRRMESWEALRHRSIRRGILDRVREDEGWRDSVRAVAGSTFANQGQGQGSAPYVNQGQMLAPYVNRGEGSTSYVSQGEHGGLGRGTEAARMRRQESEAWIDDVKRRRRGGIDLASASRSKSNTTGTITPDYQSPYDEGSTPWSERSGFRIVPESPCPPRAPVRQVGGAGITGGQGRRRQDYFNYKLPPQGSSTVPMDPTIRGAGPVGSGNARGGEPMRVSMLPLSPPRIMSPPLERELLFTPDPGDVSLGSVGAALVQGREYDSPPSWGTRGAGGGGRVNRNTILARLKERKGDERSRKVSPDVTRASRPLPLPTLPDVEPLRVSGGRAGKLVKTRHARMSQKVGDYGDGGARAGVAEYGDGVDEMGRRNAGYYYGGGGR
ncbi:hypothetical protein NMY22_g427 [Coprinellus aureogranulatus]|nr:hypothetical protein NMY22_g427 [Coprinellus aureogranulatus]